MIVGRLHVSLWFRFCNVVPKNILSIKIEWIKIKIKYSEVYNSEKSTVTVQLTHKVCTNSVQLTHQVCTNKWTGRTWDEQRFLLTCHFLITRCYWSNCHRQSKAVAKLAVLLKTKIYVHQPKTYSFYKILCKICSS